MTGNELIFDKEVLLTIQDVKQKLEIKKKSLLKFESELNNREKEIKDKEEQLENEIKNFNKELIKVTKNNKPIF